MARPKAFDPAQIVPLVGQVFRVRGYAGASLATLEEATGLGRQSLYDTFGDKAGLFASALAHEVAAEEARIAQLFDEAAAGVSALRAYLLGRATRVLEQGGCVFAWAALERGADPGVQQALSSLQTRLLGAVATVLAIAVRRGEVRGTAPVAALARAVVNHWASVPVRVGSGATLSDLTADLEALIGILRGR
ncbi:MAG: TetR/AcrR family transcriptional regulator [Gemmatimonadaceae bacterium]|nr:TetR/AcrR family transcriptional regulator [Gemmatimonadaceae bacterium]